MKSKSVTRMEINLDHLLHNYHELTQYVAPAELVPVVKSEAYGHGAVEVSRALQRVGCKHFAIAMVDEGIQLRLAGIIGEIMILGVTLPEQFDAVAEYDLTPSLSGVEPMQAWAEVARRIGRKLPYHIKVDVGLGRLGFQPEEAQVALAAAKELADVLTLRGISSHLSCPEGSKEHNNKEFERYHRFCQPFLPEFPQVARHLSASQAVLFHREIFFDLVRVGGLIYGFDYEVPTTLNLKPVLTFKTKVGQVKILPPGWGIGYGLRHIVKEPTKVALLPLGWSDGAGRTHLDKASYLVRGQFAHLVGICTDFSMLDVTHIPDVAAGDEVILVGEQGEQRQGVVQLARSGGISSSQLLGRTALRVPRVFIQDGKEQSELSILS